MAALLPEWLEVDTFQGTAWLGVVPFWLDRIKLRALPQVPGIRSFPDLNLRTYVRDKFTHSPGIFCFSFDASNLLAVLAASAFYNLPYHWSNMRLEQRSDREFAFYSRRILWNHEVVFNARYRGLGPSSRLAEHRSGTLEYFVTERNCLFSTDRTGQPVRSNLHYVPWPLEEAEAEIERNDLAASIGLTLPGTDPILHYSRRLAVYIWPREIVRTSLAPRRVTIAVTPS
jgi:uncharacterized protein YqjF (DUF2071 family)